MKRLKETMVCLFLIGISVMSYAQVLRHAPLQTNTQSYVDLSRQNFQAFLINADNLFRKGEQIEALQQLDFAVEVAPQNPEVYLHRAMLKLRIGMSKEAQADIEMAKRLNPIGPALFGMEGPTAQLDILAFYPERLYEEVTWEDRVAYYDNVLDKWYEALTAEYVTDDRAEIEVAIIHLEIILENMAMQNWEAALSELALLSLIKTDASVIYDLKGSVFLEKGELQLARVQLDKAISLNPNNYLAWYNLGRWAKSLNDNELAEFYFGKAIELNGQLSLAYFDRAYLRKIRGEASKAINDYSKVIDLSNNLMPAAYFNRALTYKKIGRLSAALNDLEIMLSIDAKNPLVWKTSGNVLLLSGFYDRAIANFTKAIELNSELGEAYFNRGIAHLLNYNVGTACNDFEYSMRNGYQRAEEKQVYFCSY